MFGAKWGFRKKKKHGKSSSHNNNNNNPHTREEEPPPQQQGSSTKSSHSPSSNSHRSSEPNDHSPTKHDDNDTATPDSSPTAAVTATATTTAATNAPELDSSVNLSMSSVSTAKSVLSSIRGGLHSMHKSHHHALSNNNHNNNHNHNKTNVSLASTSLASRVEHNHSGSGSDEEDESLPVYLTMEETLNLGVLESPHMDRQIAILDQSTDTSHSSLMMMMMTTTLDDHTGVSLLDDSSSTNHTSQQQAAAAQQKPLDDSFLLFEPETSMEEEEASAALWLAAQQQKNTTNSQPNKDSPSVLLQTQTSEAAATTSVVDQVHTSSVKEEGETNNNGKENNQSTRNPVESPNDNNNNDIDNDINNDKEPPNAQTSFASSDSEPDRDEFGVGGDRHIRMEANRDELDDMLDDMLADSPIRPRARSLKQMARSPMPRVNNNNNKPASLQKEPDDANNNNNNNNINNTPSSPLLSQHNRLETGGSNGSTSQQFWMNCLQENGVDLCASPLVEPKPKSTKHKRRSSSLSSPRRREPLTTPKQAKRANSQWDLAAVATPHSTGSDDESTRFPAVAIPGVQKVFQFGQAAPRLAADEGDTDSKLSYSPSCASGLVESTVRQQPRPEGDVLLMHLTTSVSAYAEDDDLMLLQDPKAMWTPHEKFLASSSPRQEEEELTPLPVETLEATSSSPGDKGEGNQDDEQKQSSKESPPKQPTDQAGGGGGNEDQSTNNNNNQGDTPGDNANGQKDEGDDPNTPNESTSGRSQENEKDDAEDESSQEEEKGAQEKLEIPASTSSGSESPKRIAQSIAEAKKGIAFAVVKSFDAADTEISPTDRESHSPHSLMFSFSDPKNGVPFGSSMDTNSCMDCVEVIGSSSEETTSPRKFSQSIADTKEVGQPEIVNLIQAPKTPLSSTTTGKSPVPPTSGQSRGIQDASPTTSLHRPREDSPGFPPPMSPQPRLVAKDENNDNTSERIIPFGANEWDEGEVEFKDSEDVGESTVASSHGNLECSSTIVPSWDIQSHGIEAKEPGPRNRFFQSIEELDNDPYHWAYRVWNEQDLLARSRWSHLLPKSTDSVCEEASTRAHEPKDLREPLQSQDSEESDNVDDEARDEIASPSYTTSALHPYEFRERKGNNQPRSQSARRPSERMSMPAATQNEPKQGVRRRKSFANIMQMWREKSDEQPNPHFLSPDNSMRTSDTRIANMDSDSVASSKTGRKSLGILSRTDPELTSPPTPVIIPKKDNENRKSIGSVSTAPPDFASPPNQNGKSIKDSSPASASEDRVAAARSLANTPEDSNSAPQKLFVDRRNPGKLNMALIKPVFSQASPADPRANEPAPAPLDKKYISSIFREKNGNTSRELTVANKVGSERKLQPIQSKSSAGSEAGFMVLRKPTTPQSTQHSRQLVVHIPEEQREDRSVHSSRRASRRLSVDDQLQRPSGRLSIESRKHRQVHDLSTSQQYGRKIDQGLSLSPTSRSRGNYKTVVKSFLRSVDDSSHAATQRTGDTHSPSLYFRQAPNAERRLDSVAETPTSQALVPSSGKGIPNEIQLQDREHITPLTTAPESRWLRPYSQSMDTESRASTATGLGPSGLVLRATCSYDGADSVFSDVEEEQPCECVQSIFSGNDDLADFFLPKMGMACTCGKKQLGLSNPDEPTALKNILRPWQVRFLAGFGIMRGDQLVKAHHRSAQALANSLRQYRRKHGMTAFRTKSCGMALQIWARTAKTFVRSIRKQLVEGTDKLRPPNTMEILSSFLDKMQEMHQPKPLLNSPKEGPKEEI